MGRHVSALLAAPNQAQRLLLLMDHSLEFIEFLGGGGVIQGVSAAIQTLGGYDPADLKGKHYQDIIHPDDCARAATAFAGILRGDVTAPITLRYRHKDGSWRTIQANARNFLSDPAVRAIIVLTRDLTDQLDAEASLAVANLGLRRLSQQLLVVQEKERNRIARELHDDVQQILVGLRMSMESSPRAPGNDLPTNDIETWITLVREAIDHLHALTISLRSPAIGERGLATELRAYIERLVLAEGQDIHTDINADLGSLTPDLELACFRIVQEALANAIKYSGARHLQLSVQRSGHNLTVSVSDDGVGFDLAAARARAIDAGNIGLLSMRERAALVHGSLEVRSSAGQGTRVRATFRTG
ncbi:MAG TPA: PAS domain-containing protein [Steroidobacteraceae bacterium]